VLRQDMFSYLEDDISGIGRQMSWRRTEVRRGRYANR
jgi:hypothetical protein